VLWSLLGSLFRVCSRQPVGRVVVFVGACLVPSTPVAFCWGECVCVCVVWLLYPKSSSLDAMICSSPAYLRKKKSRVTIGGACTRGAGASFATSRTSISIFGTAGSVS
jgi:hypothetical protein